ncbi:MAG: histidine ammonia-lyase [Rhodobacteraceae bacterium]|nr:histidine ammonia-lyase [Paracoccaceae bacterium]
MNEVVLSGTRAPLTDLEAVYAGRATIRIDCDSRNIVDASSAVVCAAAERDEPVYGVNTGFGKLASVRVEREDTERLQRNLILSHCAGIGALAEPRIVRLMMVLKLLSFLRGGSGVRWELVRLLESLVKKDVIPVVPSQGSVGASGDLVPLAHMSAVLVGEGQAISQGRRMKGRDALESAGLEPITLGPKEGLALINGTQFSNALALAALFDAWQVLRSSIVTAALTTDAVMGSTTHLNPETHRLRGHAGQIEIAATSRKLLEGSEIRESHRIDDSRVQDPYCVRCQPQVTGAALDLMRFVARILLIETNAVTDNPIVLVEQNEIVSGGNFHGEPVAFAADLLAIAIAETGAISQRRVAVLVDPSMSYGLPPFLAADPGLNSGFMAAEIAAASLMSENRHLANPCSTDSTPTSANQEDHVAMSAHGAFRLSRMIANLVGIVAVEAMCAAQGIEGRAPLRTSRPLEQAVKLLREHVSPVKRDRELASDIDAVSRLVRSGELHRATGYDILPLDESGLP